jgi:nucleoside-diphosphate-sugar epimerase
MIWMKRVLVTGATGFIGSRTLSGLLAKGYEVHAVTSRPPQPDERPIHWHQADLLDHSQIAPLFAAIQPTHLLHFAWWVDPVTLWTSLDNFRWVESSIDILRKFQENGGQRAVMAGSCAEYDWQYGYFKEGLTPLHPTTFYGSCKDSLQKLLMAHAARTGYSAAWGRMFFTFGTGEYAKRLVASVILSLLADQPALCSPGQQVRDYMLVDDLGSAFVQLLDSEVTGAVNVASGIGIQIRELVLMIGEKLDRVDLIKLGALPSRPNDPPFMVADVSRLRDEVGWKPEYDLSTALDKTIAWWKTQVERENA